MGGRTGAHTRGEPGDQVHACFWHGDIQEIAHVPRECVYERIAAFYVQQAHFPHMPPEMALNHKIGQGHLFQQREVHINEVARREKAREQRGGSDQIAQAQ